MTRYVVRFKFIQMPVCPVPQGGFFKFVRSEATI